MSPKALIAMSGGVDSSVAAFLMKEKGFDCVGAIMKLHHYKDQIEAEKDASGEVSDIESARSVAERMQMPFHVLYMEDQFQHCVIDKFVNTYLEGNTPNPCIYCNRHLKFNELLKSAFDLGLDYIVSGHYARIEQDPETGRYLLKKAVDEAKDQSYVLYSLTQDQLSHTIFPLGGFSKPEIRAIAEREGFVSAHKSDSQDICFIPDGDYASFIENYTGKKSIGGNFILQDGTVVGKHKGQIHYTLGQRRGLGVAYKESLYVLAKCSENNTVILGRNEDLFRKEFDMNEINLIAFDTIDEPIRCKVKTRYKHKEQLATVTRTGEDTLHVVFDEPQRAITPGQSAVMYDGDIVLGGGTILPENSK